LDPSRCGRAAPWTGTGGSGRGLARSLSGVCICIGGRAFCDAIGGLSRRRGSSDAAVVTLGAAGERRLEPRSLHRRPPLWHDVRKVHQRKGDQSVPVPAEPSCRPVAVPSSTILTSHNSDPTWMRSIELKTTIAAVLHAVPQRSGIHGQNCVWGRS
jgi:hypothetical protein